jgi:hypothetical protein
MWLKDSQGRRRSRRWARQTNRGLSVIVYSSPETAAFEKIAQKVQENSAQLFFSLVVDCKLKKLAYKLWKTLSK